MFTRFRLSSLLNSVALICFLLWIATLEDGADLLFGLGGLIGFFVGMVVLVVLAAYILGTPGTIQRRRNRGQPADSHLDDDC
jgi:hypothetical protein